MTITQEPPRMTPAAHRILDAASELYYDRGITSVGMDLVAEHAGTTKKTIYDRFGSKDGLVVAYLEARAQRWQKHVEDHLAGSPATGVERILVVVDALDAWLARGTRGCGFVNAYAELSTQSADATRVVRAEKEWIRRLYAGLAAEAGLAAPEALGRQLALVHEGAIVQLTAGGSPEALDDARLAVRAMLVP
ncbi:MAG: TetR/AcrR family transcriptional regulator [Marmoricola sp.]|jgi:AcrR family transcriptional regulator|nr:TetR/AcrR family transcriptional regulator [Marmoricola sp.]